MLRNLAEACVGQQVERGWEPQVARLRWEHAQRFLDVALVLATVFLWVPLVAFVLALKWIFDGRPLLFHQIRVGRDGREFTLHKIRTTPVDFEARPDDWPDANYPPRTRLGQWLRRFDLDELPQLWNVLRGEMSLVGPRPETAYHCERFASTLPGYEDRHRVRPGLTGLAQVNGFRGNTSMTGRLAMDLEYVSRQGLGMYLATLAATIILELEQWTRR